MRPQTTHKTAHYETVSRTQKTYSLLELHGYLYVMRISLMTGNLIEYRVEWGVGTTGCY